MAKTAKIVPINYHQRLETATIAAPLDADGQIKVMLDEGGYAVNASIAIFNAPDFSKGDRVLVIPDKLGNMYITGVLSTCASPEKTADKIQLKGGASASIDQSGQQNLLNVYSNSNELVFQYDADANKARIMAETGDLEVVAGKGSMAFSSRGNLSFDARQIQFKGRHQVEIGTDNEGDHQQSNLLLGSGKLALSSNKIKATANRGDLCINETHISGKSLVGKIASVRLVAKKIETLADTVMEKASNLYRSIKGLTQLKTGRKRTIVETTCHMKAEKTILKSDKDFKVKADKIHLG